MGVAKKITWAWRELSCSIPTYPTLPLPILLYPYLSYSTPIYPTLTLPILLCPYLSYTTPTHPTIPILPTIPQPNVPLQDPQSPFSRGRRTRPRPFCRAKRCYTPILPPPTPPPEGEFTTLLLPTVVPNTFPSCVVGNNFMAKGRTQTTPTSRVGHRLGENRQREGGNGQREGGNGTDGEGRGKRMI